MRPLARVETVGFLAASSTGYIPGLGGGGLGFLAGFGDGEGGGAGVEHGL